MYQSWALHVLGIGWWRHGNPERSEGCGSAGLVESGLGYQADPTPTGGKLEHPTIFY
jgi:hypothetical protein